MAEAIFHALCLIAKILAIYLGMGIAAMVIASWVQNG